MRLDLIDLRLFVAVAEAGSISRGALACHLSLAAASERVSGMEARLGTQLLQRGRRGVTPTAAGRTLLHHARAVTAQLGRMRDELRAFSAGLRGEVRLLSNTAGLVELVPAALRIFLAAHPNIDVDVEERTSPDIVAAVAEGRAELGVIAATADPGRLQTRPLGLDRLTVIAARAHPLAARGQVGFTELLDEPFVGLGAGALHDLLTGHAARLGRRIAHRVRLRSFEAVARLVEAGIGVAILPLAAVERHGTAGLAAIRLTDPWAERRLLACAPDLAQLPVPARLLLDVLERRAGPDAPPATPGPPRR